jgi:hypothetical protein
MRRADLVGGTGLLVLGIAFSWVALQYPYRTPTGPGSGFLPFWLGLALAALAAVLLVRTARSRHPGSPWLPAGAALRRLLLVLSGTVAFVALLPTLGMALATALFIAGMLCALGAARWPVAATIAAAVALVNYLVFTYWLRVPFPIGVLGF